MKTLLINRIAFLFILMLGWMTVRGQQQYEVPGDNFSLEGALEIFKKSASPEEFERMLNDPDARVNNLDLNGDGYIDYIRVIDRYEGNVHAFILQAVISEGQSQDIAVVTLEKLADGRAILQITGDADIYGVETIIEPTTEVRTYAGVNTSRVIVNVWSWPLVRYIYGPYYSVWVSPWAWSYRPYWWRPWRPVVYYDYYSFWSPYRSYYSVCYTHRVAYYNFYRPYRTTSVIVYNRHHQRINEYRSTYINGKGNYQSRNGRYSNSRPESVRYNSDGRIISNNNERIRSRSSSRNSIDQTRSSVLRESGNTIQRSSNNSGRYAENYNTSRSSEGSTSNAHLRRSDGNANRLQSTGRPTGNTNMRSSSGNSSIQRSDVKSNDGANYRRANSSSNVQRSTGRSNGSPDIQRSQPRSGSNSNFRPSSGGSNSPKSYGRTSGNSGTRYSPGSSNVRKSTGNGSGIQRSSSRSSVSSNSRNSGSSNESNRGRR